MVVLSGHIIAASLFILAWCRLWEYFIFKLVSFALFISACARESRTIAQGCWLGGCLIYLVCLRSVVCCGAFVAHVIMLRLCVLWVVYKFFSYYYESDNCLCSVVCVLFLC